jgi:hypothetical protein
VVVLHALCSLVLNILTGYQINGGSLRWNSPNGKKLPRLQQMIHGRYLHHQLKTHGMRCTASIGRMVCVSTARNWYVCGFDKYSLLHRRISTSKIWNAHNIKTYISWWFWKCEFEIINVDTFFCIVSQTLRSFTISKYYRHPILRQRW